MVYKHICENAIAQIEATRQREIEVAKQRVMQEEVAPFNRDIETALRDAISELQTQHNAKIAALQQAFEAEKHDLTDAARKRKEAFAETAVATATAAINAEADGAIAHIKKYIGEGA
jgi:hemerythrin superfamily protein